MAKIHPEVLEKLQKKLGVRDSRVYDLVAQIAGATGLPRHLAALKLAADNKINISKKEYATDEERARLGGIAPTPRASAAPAVIASQPPPRKSSKGKAHKAAPARKSNQVFVVHGRDKKARDAMFTFLRSIALQPMEWSKAVKLTKKASPYVGEVVAAAFDQVAAVVVLLTPDDEGKVKKKFLKTNDAAHERNLTGQARLNVIFEAGRAFGTHPKQTIIVEMGETRPFSDTGGIHTIRMADDAESRKELAQRLETAGCAVDLDGEDWLSAGDFGA